MYNGDEAPCRKVREGYVKKIRRVFTVGEDLRKELMGKSRDTTYRQDT